MFKSYLFSALMIVASLSSSAHSNAATDDSENVSNAYTRLIEAEHQLLKSEIALEARKSAQFESLLSGGHSTWLENRSQKLIVDILKAELAAYEQFESQSMTTLNDGNIKFEPKLGSVKTDANETRLEMIGELQKELTSLRQTEAKLANGLATLLASDPWVEGYRMRHALTGDQADVLAAKILLLEQLSDGRNETSKAPAIAATTKKSSTLTAAWKRPSRDSNSMKLMISQAELQIQLSQHHLLNETRRLTGLQELAAQGMATERSINDSNQKVNQINDLLKEQQDNLSWLKKDLDASPESDQFYTSIKVSPPNDSQATRTNLTAMQTVMNQFELGQANYLRREAILKGEMYREVLGRLEQAIALQQSPSQFSGTSGFSDALIQGQQREMEQYRWKIKKTELQRDLADAEIALLKEPGSSQRDNFMLASSGSRSSFPVLVPSRFLSSDPFGLQTTYSAFTFNSPVFKARRPVSADRADLSSVFRPIINRDALSFYRSLQSSRFGGFSRVHPFGSFNSGFRPLPGTPVIGASPFRSGNSHFNTFNSFGRSSQIFRSTGIGRY